MPIDTPESKTPKLKTDPLFITPLECCEILKMSPRMFYGFIRSNTGPRYKKWGKLIRIRYTDFMKWTEQDHKSPPKG